MERKVTFIFLLITFVGFMLLGCSQRSTPQATAPIPSQTPTPASSSPTPSPSTDFILEEHPFPLEGAHADLTCKACHPGGIFEETPTECVACHTDPHAGTYGEACDQCHNTTTFKDAQFEHTFPLDHGNAEENCAICHSDDNYVTYTCYNCHNEDNVIQKHQEKEIIITNNCTDCHPKGK